MALTARRVITGLSVLYLLGLTALAGYALHSVNLYSLPIYNAQCALTIALPALAGVALEAVISLNEKLAARGQLQKSRIFQIVVAFFLVFESVLATLAGTHISPPGSLTCALRETWQDLFHKKEGEAIRRIQDAFSCCGFNSVQDMAFPLPDQAHGADACVVRYERDQACFEPWREEERKVAIMLLVVPLAVFLWKLAIILAPSSRSSWLPSHIRLPSDASEDDSGPRRTPRAAIEYRDIEGQEGNGRDTSLQREVTNLNKDSHLASHVERQRTKSSNRRNERRNEINVWQEEAAEAEGTTT